MRFTAKLETVSKVRGIVTLYDSAGVWAGSYRVDAARKHNLYETAYVRASQEVAVKGGILDRFSRV